MQILVVLSIQIFFGPDYILYLLELGRQFYLVIITSPYVANKMGVFFALNKPKEKHEAKNCNTKTSIIV